MANGLNGKNDLVTMIVLCLPVAMLKNAISSTSLIFFLKLLSRIFPLKVPRNCSDRWGKQLRVRRHQSRSTGPLRWLAKKIFFSPIKIGEFKCFWNWFGKSNCSYNKLSPTKTPATRLSEDAGVLTPTKPLDCDCSGNMSVRMRKVPIPWSCRMILTVQ